MALAQLIHGAREGLEKRIISRGEDSESLYSPITATDNADKSKATSGLRVMGSEGEGQEAWLTVYSRDAREVCCLELSAQYLDDWEDAGDREAGERLYRKKGADIILGFDEDGSATMIYQEQDRPNPFTNEEYRGLISRLFDEMIALLARGG